MCFRNSIRVFHDIHRKILALNIYIASIINPSTFVGEMTIWLLEFHVTCLTKTGQVATPCRAVEVDWFICCRWFSVARLVDYDNSQEIFVKSSEVF